MIADEDLEGWLQDYAAALEAGILDDAVGEAGLDALAAGVRISPGSEQETAPVGSTRVPGGFEFANDDPAPRTGRVWLTGTFLAAASLLLAVGIGWGLLSGMGGAEQAELPYAEDPLEDDSDRGLAQIPGALPLWNGQGQLVPMGNETLFRVIDPVHGRIQLDRGEVYVDLGDSNRRAEVETPAGKATAVGPGFYVRYAPVPRRRGGVQTTDGKEPPQDLDSQLTVAILGGVVEVSNVHGRVIGTAGEVVVADAKSPPKPDASAGNFSRSGGDSERYRAARLVFWPPVAKELELSKRQQGELQRVLDRSSRNFGMLMHSMCRLSSEERMDKTMEFHSQRRQQIADVLNPEQEQRLVELELQYETALALEREEIAQLLDVTIEQQQQIAALGDGYRAVRREVFDAARRNGDWDAARTLRVAHKQQVSQAVIAVLNEQQQQQWFGMVGAPFFLEDQMLADYEQFWWESHRHSYKRSRFPGKRYGPPSHFSRGGFGNQRQSDHESANLRQN